MKSYTLDKMEKMQNEAKDRIMKEKEQIEKEEERQRERNREGKTVSESVSFE